MREGSGSFFEKKEPKKLCPLASVARHRQSQMDKSFLLLFFKKEALACGFPD
jgi:hypothetical protein